jgi:OmpA-OmpF porin, OOP family
MKSLLHFVILAIAVTLFSTPLSAQESNVEASALDAPPLNTSTSEEINQQIRAWLAAEEPIAVILQRLVNNGLTLREAAYHIVSVDPAFDEATYLAARDLLPHHLPAWACAPSCSTTRLTLDAEALFDFDKDLLRPDATQILDDVVEYLGGKSDDAEDNNASPVESVKVIGHTDSIGSVEYNQDLSERRALRVSNYLKTSIPNLRISTEGRSELEPRATNSTPEGRQLNRRVEIIYDRPGQACGDLPERNTELSQDDENYAELEDRYSYEVDHYQYASTSHCLAAVLDAIGAAGGNTAVFQPGTGVGGPGDGTSGNIPVIPPDTPASPE